MRLFVALNFPPALQGAVYDAVAPLRAAAPSARWTRPDRLHLTLDFLGERAGDVVAPLSAALDGVAARHRAIALELRGVGAFPSFRRPRVVWVGLTPTAELARLHADVNDACAALGFPREERVFRPHVTLARIAPRTTRADVEALAGAAPSVVVEAAAIVRTLDLVESVAGRYVTVHAAPLAA